MATFEALIKIDAPVQDVWKALSDIGSIHRWNPGVVSSHVNTDQEEGVGAGRRCYLGGKNYLDERVVAWEEGKRLTMRIIGTNLPFKTADIRFTLSEENDSTVVTVSPDYELKFGPIGKLIDFLFARRAYEKGMNELLAGLKGYVEGKSEVPAE